MNIVLCESFDLSSFLVQELSACPGISLYISISAEDTMRIVRCIHPDAILLESRSPKNWSLARQLSDAYPEIGVFVCSAMDAARTRIQDFRSKRQVGIRAILEMSVQPKPNEQ